MSLLMLVIAVFSASAQSPAIDSLLKLISHAGHDSSKVLLHLKLAGILRAYDAERAMKHVDAADAILKNLDNDYYKAYYAKTKCECLFGMAKYAEVHLYADTAIMLYDRLINAEEDDPSLVAKYKFAKADCLISKGLVAAKQYRYHESFQYYQQGIVLIENVAGIERNDVLATLHIDIASNYYELEQFEESLKYDRRVLNYLDSNYNIDLYVIGNLFVADDFSSLSQFDSSSWYLEQVRPVVLRLNRPSLDVRFYYILGTIQRKKKQWANALVSFQKADEAARRMKDDFQVVNSAEGIAASHLNLGNLDKARELALFVLDESSRIDIPLGKMQAYQLLSEIEEKAGHIVKAFQYQKQFIIVNDSIKKEKTQRQMNDAEVKYQAERKENEILQLQKSNAVQSLSLQKKSTFNSFLIGSMAALLITGFLGFRNFHHRHQLAKQTDQLHQQRISELEKDKQLIAVDSMLKGQEDERSRLAKDLHDGLGGLLSGVKFSLSNVRENLVMNPDSMVVFERSLDMLDTSIKELRRVAHNMMPEMLTKFGLDEALKEYCSTVNATKILKLKYQSLGMGMRLDKAKEIIVYRIVQELVSNILKHASASEAFIQLIREDNRLNVVVEDNGRGFDTAMIDKSSGAGWANIRSRVEYLKGQMDIHSEPGKGTLVNIEFNV